MRTTRTWKRDWSHARADRALATASSKQATRPSGADSPWPRTAAVFVVAVVMALTATLLVAGASPVAAASIGPASVALDDSGWPGPDADITTNSSIAASSLGPGFYGENVTFTGSVSSTPLPPGGTVTVAAGSLSFASAPPSTVYVDNSLPVGNHAVSSTFSGHDNGTDNWLASAISLGGGWTVIKAPSMTSVGASPNPSAAGANVTLTATVAKDETTAGVPLPGAGSPTGTVTFRVDGVAVGTAPLAAGVATLATEFCVGSYEVTVEYPGDSNFLPSGGVLSPNLVVNKGTTTLALTASNSSILAGESVTFTATVSHSGVSCPPPIGQVTFKANGVVIELAPLSGSGVATISTDQLAPGTYTIAAEYEGDSNNNPSVGNLSGSLTVAYTPSDVTLAGSGSPSKYGQLVTFTATVVGDPPGAVLVPGAGVPSGFVLFKDGGESVGLGLIDGAGVASFTTGALDADGDPTTHDITAYYGGNAYYASDTSNTVNHDVERADTTTVVASSVSPSKFGEMVTFTATVTVDLPGGGEPTGTVSFVNTTGGTDVLLGVSNLNIGVATFSTALLDSDEPSKVHAIRAVYGGNLSYNASSSTMNQTVEQAVTQITTSSDPNPTVYGEPITLKATITVDPPGRGIPTGTVIFRDVTSGSTELGRASVIGDSTSSFVITPDNALSPGVYRIQAEYLDSSNKNFDGSTSPSHFHTVNKADTDTVVRSTTTISVFGEEVSWTATVSPVSPGSGVPTGDVNFIFREQLTSTIIETHTGTLDSSSGIANVAMSDFSAPLPVDTYDVEVAYLGDAEFNTSTDTSLDHEVVKADTGVVVSADISPSIYGQTVILTAVVSVSAPGAGDPTGTITFQDGGTDIAGCVAVALSGSPAFDATCTLSLAALNALDAGPHTLSADYSGDGSFNVSTGDVAQTVNRADTTTGLTASPSPSSAGQSVTFTAVVSAVSPGAGPPLGDVEFRRAGILLSTETLVPDGGGGDFSEATYATSSLPVGENPIQATYVPTTIPVQNYNDSTDTLFHEVGGVATTTTVSSSPTSSVFGEPVTLSSTVSPATPAPGPTGTVRFKAQLGPSITPVGQATLTAGTASLLTGSLPVGSLTLTAHYDGDSQFSSSTSPDHAHVVSKADTTTTVVGSPNPSVAGEAVTFTANVTVVAPGAGTPSGMVTFKEGATTIGIGFLNASGQATMVTSALTVGPHSITAEYGGDANFNSSTGSGSQTVNKADTTTVVTSDANPSLVGATVTFTALVSPVAPAVGIPTGTVTFKDGASTIAGCASVSLNPAGEAACATATLTLGAHSITAEYSGDGSFNSSAGGMTQNVSDIPVDLAVLKTSTPNPVKAGDSVTYSITVTNAAAVAVGVTLTDPLPPELLFVSMTPAAGWSCTTPAVGSGGTVSCTTAGLPGGGVAVFTLVADVPLDTPAGTVLANTVSVAGTLPDPDLTNNSSTNETTVYRTRFPLVRLLPQLPRPYEGGSP